MIGKGVLADVFEHAGYYTIAQVRSADLDSSDRNILRQLQGSIDILKADESVRVTDWFRVARAAYFAVVAIQQADVCLDVPAPFQCPITGTWFEDPVIAPSGITYERSAIVRWVRVNATDPQTRSELRESDLIANRALKDAIVIYRPLEERYTIRHDVIV